MLSGFEVKGTTKGCIDSTSSPTHWFFLTLIHRIVIYPLDSTIHCLNRSEGQSFTYHFSCKNATTITAKKIVEKKLICIG